MSKAEKLLDRFLKIPKDLIWEELVSVLEQKGYTEMKVGKTGGSRRKFSNAKGKVISLHKPHPENIVKIYVIKQVIQSLQKEDEK